MSPDLGCSARLSAGLSARAASTDSACSARLSAGAAAMGGGAAEGEGAGEGGKKKGAAEVKVLFHFVLLMSIRDGSQLLIFCLWCYFNQRWQIHQSGM